MMVTPLCDYGLAGRVSSQLPPRSAAISTMTEPRCIASHHFCGHQDGRLPSRHGGGRDHYVLLAHARLPSARAGGDSLLRRALSRTRPALPRSDSISSMTNFAPRLSICSFTAERTSYAADHRAETPRGRDRLQPGDSCADDQNLRRRELFRPPSSSSGTCAGSASAASSTPCSPRCWPWRKARPCSARE